MIQLALGRAKDAIDRKGAGDICGVTVELTTAVNQYQVAVHERLVVVDIVQDTAVVTGADNGRIGPVATAVSHKLVQQLGFEVIFIESGLAGLHGPNMGAGGNFCRAPHQLELGGALQQALLVQ